MAKMKVSLLMLHAIALGVLLSLAAATKGATTAATRISNMKEPVEASAALKGGLTNQKEASVLPAVL
jgi:hypothetical protein